MKQINVFAEAETPMELKAGSVKTAEYTIHQTYDLDAMKAQLAEDERSWLLLLQRMIKSFSGPVSVT